MEDKKISVTYHYKGVNDKLKAKLIETAKGLIQSHGFQLIETPYALEGKPRVNWDKGKSLKLHITNYPYYKYASIYMSTI